MKLARLLGLPHGICKVKVVSSQSNQTVSKSLGDYLDFHGYCVFGSSEILFPQSEVAPRAALMAAYSYYSQNYYLDAIAELEKKFSNAF